jgi:hypothetical protein
MNIGRSLTFIFEDPRWTSKILIGIVVLLASSLLSVILIGILGFFIVAGYGLETLRNVRNGERYPMPEWRDRWGEWLILGLKLAIAVFIWALPLMFLGLVMIVPASMTGASDDFWTAIGGLGMVVLGCLTFLWLLVLLVVQPGIYVRLAETESLGAALRVGDILAFTRDHIGDVIIVSLVYLVASFVIGTLGFIAGTLLCLVGLVVTLPAAELFTMLIQAHLYAQVGTGASSTALATAGPPSAAPARDESYVDLPEVRKD